MLALRYLTQRLQHLSLGMRLCAARSTRWWRATLLELAAFDGMKTAAGYQFHSGLTANQDIYRLSFQVAAVPEPRPMPFWARAC